MTAGRLGLPKNDSAKRSMSRNGSVRINMALSSLVLPHARLIPKLSPSGSTSSDLPRPDAAVKSFTYFVPPLRDLGVVVGAKADEVRVRATTTPRSRRGGKSV